MTVELKPAENGLWRVVCDGAPVGEPVTLRRAKAAARAIRKPSKAKP